MARKRSTKNDHDDAGFRFTPEARDELLRILRNKPDLIRTLEERVSPGTPHADRRARQRRQIPQWQRLMSAVEELRLALEVLDLEMQFDLQTGNLGRMAYENESDEPEIDLAGLNATLDDIERVTAWLLAQAKPGRRGAPGGIQVDRFFHALSVAVALAQAGVSVSTYRNGVLAQTLTITMTEAGLRPPEDLFPTLKRVVPPAKKRQRANPGRPKGR